MMHTMLGQPEVGSPNSSARTATNTMPMNAATQNSTPGPGRQHQRRGGEADDAFDGIFEQAQKFHLV